MSLPNLSGALDKLLPLTLNRWATILNTLVDNPITKGAILTKVSLKAGANVINHGLGRQLQGWQVVRQRASATIYDTQDSNPTPNLTLLLTASAPVSVDLYVF